MEYATPATLTDANVLARTHQVAADARRTGTELVALLAEMDARQLFLGEGYSSLYVYCQQALRLSEGETANRIVAARAARLYPVILELLRSGEINLTTVRLLAPHLTAENH